RVLDADEAALDLSVLDELVRNGADRIRRDREAQPLRLIWIGDQRVHPDDLFYGGPDERAPGVPGVDRGVGRDEIVEEDGLQFPPGTTEGRSPVEPSTIGSTPAGTTTGADVARAVATGVGPSSAGVRPSSSVAVGPPATPPRMTPTKGSAAPLGPLDRGRGSYETDGGAGSYIGGGSTAGDGPEFRRWASSPCGGARSDA